MFNTVTKNIFSQAEFYWVFEIPPPFVLTGWQWDPKDRPTFLEIHNSLEHMFDKSSLNEGNSPTTCVEKCQVIKVFMVLNHQFV